MSEVLYKRIMGTVMITVGFISLMMPNLIYKFIIYGAFAMICVNAVSRIYMGIVKKSRGDLFTGLLSAGFAVILCFYSYLPMLVIQIIFGVYCLLICLSMTLQELLYIYNGEKTKLLEWAMSISYLVIGLMLIFSPRMSTELLLNLFGVYFVLLGIRYFTDAVELEDPGYRWHSRFHISLPTALAAFIPSIYLNSINKMFQKVDKSKSVPILRDDQEPPLKVMVHIGPEGLQTVGHMTLAWKGLVYSYGNYDTSSSAMMGMLGDGCLFLVPFERYIPNLMRYEQNTIFEYGIQVTPEQEKELEAQLAKIRANTYRWYSKLEYKNDLENFEKYESDYPSRLWYRTGAKFYKFKRGRLKTYWVLGENCSRFVDQTLGVISTDVLSIRGIVTPGSYFDYLQNEYLKDNTPVVSCVIHPRERSESEEA